MFARSCYYPIFINWDSAIGNSLYDDIAQTSLPFQLVTTPLFEGFGTPAWQVMKRRAGLAVAARLPRDSGIFESWGASIEKQQQSPRGGGAAWHLLGRLREEVARLQEAHRRDRRQPAVTVTLVGHSMGTLLLDRLVAVSGDELPIANIVYPAPASSADDIACGAWRLHRAPLHHPDPLPRGPGRLPQALLRDHGADPAAPAGDPGSRACGVARAVRRRATPPSGRVGYDTRQPARHPRSVP